MSDFDNAPPWFKWALHELGTREQPENRGPVVRRYIELAHAGEEGDPWCAIFVNAALETCGVHGSRSAGAHSFIGNALFTPMLTPALGCLAIFWRGAPRSGLGHVGFYRGESANGEYLYILGGNEGDMVQIEALPRNGRRMGLLGYGWPTAAGLAPVLAKIIMPGSTPAHDVKVV